MNAPRARRLLWTGLLLFAPLPHLVAVEGAVPVVRFAWLGAVAGAYAALVDGSGIAWTMTALLLGQALVYAAVLWALAALGARLLPERARGAAVLSLLVAGLALAVATPLYHTPFAADAPRARWTGLFR